MDGIGFIGLGIMGKPMARNLLKAGYKLVVYDINPDPVGELSAEGAAAGVSIEDVGKQCPMVITMLPDGPDVEKVSLGDKGLAGVMRPGSLLIDMSSIAPGVTQKVGAVLSGKGCRMLDAPVSGGEAGAIAGTLAIMVGGDDEDFKRARPMLEKMGKSVVLVGALGAGQVAKLVNQMLVAIHIAGMGEAFCMAVKAGVEPGKVFDAIKGGLAGSSVLTAKMPAVLARNFKPGFRMSLHQKDLNNALVAGRELGVCMPLTGIVQQLLTSLVARGKGDEDHSGLVQLFEELGEVRIESQKR